MKHNPQAEAQTPAADCEDLLELLKSAVDELERTSRSLSYTAQSIQITLEEMGFD